MSLTRSFGKHLKKKTMLDSVFCLYSYGCTVFETTQIR